MTRVISEDLERRIRDITASSANEMLASGDERQHVRARLALACNAEFKIWLTEEMLRGTAPSRVAEALILVMADFVGTTAMAMSALDDEAQRQVRALICEGVMRQAQDHGGSANSLAVDLRDGSFRAIDPSRIVKPGGTA